jgi:carboxymethylenebutenolidase
MGNRLGISRRQAIAGLAASAVPILLPRNAAALPYDDLTYPSGQLTIQAYLYRPLGSGPFPTIIYNHGSREGHENQSVPWVRICGLFVDAGYAVLAPERRGYGKSDGSSWSEAVGRDVGQKFLDRCRAEADDVLAAAYYATTLPFVDRSRLGIIGWSLGGIVSMFAISRSNVFRAAIDQAGGDLTWRHSPVLQSALADAVRAAQCPVLLMDDANDAAPEALPGLADVMATAGRAHKLAMYPAFTPSQPMANIAPGHLMFGPDGLSIWGKDAVGFFNSYLKA